jgi:hypothetical protein
MQDILIIPKFHTVGDFWKKNMLIWALAEYSFVDIRNKAIEIVNPLYEQINKDFEAEYPDHVMSGPDDELYNAYVSKIVNEHLADFNNELHKHYGYALFEMWSNPENADLMLYIEGRPDTYMYMTFEFANEEDKVKFG